MNKRQYIAVFEGGIQSKREYITNITNSRTGFSTCVLELQLNRRIVPFPSFNMGLEQ